MVKTVANPGRRRSRRLVETNRREQWNRNTRRYFEKGIKRAARK